MGLVLCARIIAPCMSDGGVASCLSVVMCEAIFNTFLGAYCLSVVQNQQASTRGRFHCTPVMIDIVPVLVNMHACVFVSAIYVIAIPTLKYTC